MKKFYAILTLLFVIFVVSPVKGESSMYVRPILGYAIPVDGSDGSLAIGGALGYTLMERLSLEASYTRLIGSGSAPDNNLVELSGTFSIYFPVLSPFAKAGGGFYKFSAPGAAYKGFIDIGLGAELNIIPIINVGAGLSYMALFDGPDYVYPYLYAGLSF